MNLIPRSAMLLASLLVFSPIAISKDYSNIKDFVVSGISLGDTSEEVIKGLTEFYSISQDDLEIVTEYNGDAIEYIELQAEGAEVVAYFEPIDDSDKSENQTVLMELTIRYEQPIDDFDAYAAKIFKKYGSPSNTIGSSLRKGYVWCEKSINDNCDQNHLMYAVSHKEIFLGFPR